jgi:hypothetical protein
MSRQNLFRLPSASPHNVCVEVLGRVERAEDVQPHQRYDPHGYGGVEDLYKRETLRAVWTGQVLLNMILALRDVQ